MNCSICNGIIEKKTDVYLFHSIILGEVPIPDVDFEECQGCQERSLSPESSHCVSKFVREREQLALSNIPAKDLITASEAAQILGVTKQAFSKNPRIKRGFIYFTKIGDRKFYSKTSVRQYAETGDGRCQLLQQSTMTPARYHKTDHTQLAAQPQYSQEDEQGSQGTWDGKASIAIRTHDDCTS